MTAYKKDRQRKKRSKIGRLKQFFKEKTKQKRSPNLGIHVCACAYCIRLVCKLAENQKKFLVNNCSFSLLTCIWQLPKGLQCLVEFDSQPLFGIIQGLVFAGIADLARPADKLSPSQSTALAATGKHTVHDLYLHVVSHAAVFVLSCDASPREMAVHI